MEGAGISVAVVSNFQSASGVTPTKMTDVVETPGVQVPQCARGIGHVITNLRDSEIIAGVSIQAVDIWPDDRGHFMEVLRIGRGLPADFPVSGTQVSATVTHAGVIKAFHYHLRQCDCWTVVKGMLQVALVDLRADSPTFGFRNTMYVGELRPWQVRIPPGVAHGYKVIGTEAAVLVYVTSSFYTPTDERRIPYDDAHLNYAWETQYK
jgi:dTDP-4-dehydrorhamnose 3,5-epimerase